MRLEEKGIFLLVMEADGGLTGHRYKELFAKVSSCQIWLLVSQ
jgi:hypothetical protein